MFGLCKSRDVACLPQSLPTPSDSLEGRPRPIGSPTIAGGVPQRVDMDNRRSLIAVSPDSLHNYNFDDKDNLKECTYSALLHSPPNFNVDDGRPLSCNSITGANQSTTEILNKHKSTIKSSPELCHPVDKYNEGIIKIFMFFSYLSQSIADLRKVDGIIKGIINSLKLQRYKDAKERLQEFLGSKLPFTKDLIDKLSEVLRIQQSMLEVLEQKKELESKHQTFKESREVWSSTYKLVALVFSVSSTLLISLAAPPVAIAAIPVAVSILAVGDRTLEVWANSNEANMRQNIEKAQSIITLSEDPRIEMHELRIVQNNLKKLVKKVHSVLRKSVSGDFEVSLDDNVLEKRIEEIIDAKEGLMMSLMLFETKVNAAILRVESSMLPIQQDNKFKATKCLPAPEFVFARSVELGPNICDFS